MYTRLTTVVLLVAATLSMAAAPPPDTKAMIRQGVQLSLQGDYEASDEIFKNIDVIDPALDFYRLVNAFKLNKKALVEKYASNILDRFSNGGIEYPQRYIDLATIMRVEAAEWKHDADDLADIAREMDKASDRLKNAKGGKDTQKIQKDVLARLDKMIKDIEDKKKADEEAAAKADADAQKKRIEEMRQVQPPSDTHKGSDDGKGHIDPKRMKYIVDNWGKLPEKERARCMAELTRHMPTKDKAVIEAYFRELAKKKGK